MAADELQCSLNANAPAEHRLLRGRHRTAEPARRAEAQPVAAPERRRHDVRQRRQLRPAARRAGRPAAGRHPQVRAGAVAQRARGAAGPARAAADARAREARRPYRRQPAAVDDAALQRRLPRRDRRPARAAWLPRARLAGQRAGGVGVRGVRRRLGDARRGRSRCRPDVRPVRQADLARAAGVDPSDRRQGDQRVRRRDHRARQLLHEPDADLPRARRRRSAVAHERADHPHREPADRRTRHDGLHRRRCGRAHRRSHRPPGRRRHHQHEVAVAAGARPLRAGAQGAARPGHAARALRAGRRRVLDQRDREARSPAARVRGLGGAVAAAAGGNRDAAAETPTCFDGEHR